MKDEEQQKKQIAVGLLNSCGFDVSAEHPLVTALAADLELDVKSVRVEVPEVSLRTELIVLGRTAVQQTVVRSYNLTNVRVNLDLKNTGDVLTSLPDVADKAAFLTSLAASVWGLASAAKDVAEVELDKRHSAVFAAAFLTGRSKDWVVDKGLLLRAANERLDEQFRALDQDSLENVLIILDRLGFVRNSSGAVTVVERQLLGEINSLAKAFPKSNHR